MARDTTRIPGNLLVVSTKPAFVNDEGLRWPLCIFPCYHVPP